MRNLTVIRNFTIILAVCSVLALGACTAREVATGAAAAGAGYVVGKEAGDDD